MTLKIEVQSPQEDIYNYMKKKALSYEGKISQDLKSYRSNQKKKHEDQNQNNKFSKNKFDEPF